MTTPSLYPKETAVVIRKLLKASFPATKFSVRTPRYAMASSVEISWTDGPTVASVDAIVGCFEAGSFDGMTDSYDYDRTARLIIEGVHYRPGTRYVSTSRTISTAFAQKLAVAVGAYFGVEIAVEEAHGAWRVAGDSVVAGQYASTLIYQASQDRRSVQLSTVEG